MTISAELKVRQHITRGRFFLLQLLPPIAAIAIIAAESHIPLPPAMTRVLAIMMWMIVWWLSEIIPLGVTALLPILCFPLLGIMDLRTATSAYGDPIVFLFMGGMILAMALEKWQLHRRLSLYILRFTGHSPRGILLGFMVATAFISLWISNTATTLMMLPLVLSVLRAIGQEDIGDKNSSLRPFAVALLLGVAYASSIGGMGTLIGTPTNAVFASYSARYNNIGINFGEWMINIIPLVLILFIVTWFLLGARLRRIDNDAFKNALEKLSSERRSLGKIGPDEKKMLLVFFITAFLWMFHNPITGYLNLPALSDTAIAVAAAISLFFIPARDSKSQFLLEWHDIQRMPWNILLLFGGGLCLASALESSGTLQWLGNNFLSDLQAWHPLMAMLAVTLLVTFLSEIMSNVALITILLPMLHAISIASDIPFFVIAVPATLAASCGFMLPMATPPNAIVFSSGSIRIHEMMRSGLALNLVASLIIALYMQLPFLKQFLEP
jgi:sodium-dependent dicarboxylate transporter 2/3/5